MGPTPKASSLIRAGGMVVATLLPRDKRKHAVARAMVLAGTDAEARRLDPLGLSPISIDVGADAPSWQRWAAELLPSASWAVEGLLFIRVLRRVPAPLLFRALGIGAIVYIADQLLHAKLAPVMDRARQEAERRAVDDPS